MKELEEKAKKIKCVICDLDGVLTNGNIFIDNDNRVIIATRNYIEELKNAVTKFYNLTFVVRDENYLGAAQKGIEYILET